DCLHFLSETTMYFITDPMELVAATNTTHNDSDTCTNLYDHRGWAQYFLPTVYSLICIVGLLGNVLALHVIWPNLKKINSTTLYSANLVVSDILFLLALPLRTVYYANGFHWPMGEGLCKAVALLFYINMYAGVNFMTCLSVDRFIAVVLPLRFSRFRKVQKIDNLPVMLIGAVLLGFGIPVITILLCYSALCSKLRLLAKSNKLTEKSGRSRKAIGVICTVILVFVVCYTPYHIDLLQYMIRKLRYKPDCSELHDFQISLHITVCLMNLNSCLDPFIYFFACKGYKKKILKLLRKQVSMSFSSVARTSPEGSSKDVFANDKIHMSTRSTQKERSSVLLSTSNGFER
uniref:G protein-coupled receptor 183a n=1 Tax=Cyprinus carpio TaxID=7962 RepID=A0A8C2CWE2_CYPCA